MSCPAAYTIESILNITCRQCHRNPLFHFIRPNQLTLANVTLESIYCKKCYWRCGTCKKFYTVKDEPYSYYLYKSYATKEDKQIRHSLLFVIPPKCKEEEDPTTNEENIHNTDSEGEEEEDSSPWVPECKLCSEYDSINHSYP